MGGGEGGDARRGADGGVWCGVAWHVGWCGMACGLVWCGMACGLVWCGMWCGVVWCGVVCDVWRVVHHIPAAKGKVRCVVCSIPVLSCFFKFFNCNLCGVVWCGVVWCGMGWFEVV